MNRDLIPEADEPAARAAILQIVQKFGSNAMPELVRAVGSADLLRLLLAELWPELFQSPEPEIETLPTSGRIARTFRLDVQVVQATGANVLLDLGGIKASGEVTVTADASVWADGTGLCMVSGRLTSLSGCPGDNIPQEKIEAIRFDAFETVLMDGTVAIEQTIEKAGLKVVAYLTPDLAKHTATVEARLTAIPNGIASLVASEAGVSGTGTLIDERVSDEHLTPVVSEAVTPVVATGRPVMVGSLTYAWPAAVQAGTLADELAAVQRSASEAGAYAGLTLEVQGLGARPGSDSKDWKQEYALLCGWMPEVIHAALNRGLRVNLYLFNTNTPGKGWKDSWNAKDVAGNRKAVLDCVGPLLAALPDDPRLLICPHNETDGSTHPSIMADLVAACRGKVSRDRLISTAEPASWAKWVDVHPQKLAAPKPCGPNVIITSDSGIIGELMEGGTWATTPKPIPSACAKFATAHAAAGILAFYTVGSVPTAARYRAEWAEVLKSSKGGAGGGGTGIPADAVAFASATMLGPHHFDPSKLRVTRRMKSASNRGGSVAIEFEPLNWPTQSGKKTVDGGVCIGWMDGTTLVGGFFDWHGKNQTVKDQKNIPGGYLSGKQPPNGAPIWYWLVNIALSERTNMVSGGTWKA